MFNFDKSKMMNSNRKTRILKNWPIPITVGLDSTTENTGRR